MESATSESDTSADAADVVCLNYHADIELVHHPKIYRGNDTESGRMESRRILFYNLPPSVIALQVARAAAAYGQVLLVNVVAPVARGTDNGSMTMLVEFATSQSSIMCQMTVNSNCPKFVSQNGELFIAGIWVVPTPSFPVASDISECLDKGYTRTVAITPISIECVWFMIRVVAAPRDILDAEYDTTTRTLALEFTSVDTAYRTARLLGDGVFDFIFADEVREKRLQPCMDRVAYGGYAAYLPPDHLQQRFDRAPFNGYWPDRYYYIMTQRNLHPRANYMKRNTSSSDAATTDGDSDETLSSAASSLDDEPRGRSGFPGNVLSPKKRKREPKELLASVDDTPMTGSWDQFFENRHTMSLRGCVEYGKIAKHRRELSAKQGLAEGIVPKCGGNCELGCKDIKDTPRFGEVDKFLAMPQEDLLIEF